MQGPLDILGSHVVLVEVLVQNGCYSEQAVDVSVVGFGSQAAGDLVEVGVVGVVSAALFGCCLQHKCAASRPFSDACGRSPSASLVRLWAIMARLLVR